MIRVYSQNQTGIQAEEWSCDNLGILQRAVWVDLLHPTRLEEETLESYFHLDIPTKSDVEEIEPSSRVYVENGILFMTATMVALSDSPEVKKDIVTFILSEKVLITVRYAEFHAFKLFSTKVVEYKKPLSPMALFIDLLDASIDRLADILEKISHNFDEASRQVLQQKNAGYRTKDMSYKAVLQGIGMSADLETKARESLISFARLITFLKQTDHLHLSPNLIASLSIIDKDAKALSDYSGFLSSKLSFLLDATLGMISIEQNAIIKIFTVAAVVFLPPTLIASIYGMNFEHISELHWRFGYPFSLVLMVISALLPFWYFKKKKWL